MFRGGVVSTLSPWVMIPATFVAWVRAGAVVASAAPACCPQIGVRVDPDFLKLIDEWRRKQDVCRHAPKPSAGLSSWG